MTNEFFNSIIDSCHQYWQEDSTVTVITFESKSDSVLDVFIVYSDRIPYVSQDYKDFAIRSRYLDAEKLRTIDDCWGYWTIINHEKTNFVLVSGENKDEIPRSLLNVDMLQDIHSIKYPERNRVYYGGGHVKHYKILHRDKDSVLSRSTPVQEILFWKVSQDIVFD